MAYTRGNLAVKEKAAERTHPGYREKTKVVTRRTYLPMKEKFLYLLTVVICVMVASLLIWQNANIYDLNKQGQEAESNTKKMNLKIKEMNAERQRLMNGIRDQALKMGYIQPTGQDAITVPRTHTNTNKEESASGTETEKK